MNPDENVIEMENVVTVEEWIQREELEEAIDGDASQFNDLQLLLIHFAGNHFQPKDGRVTTELILRAIGEQFPALIMTLAEKNYFAGYKQALDDIEKVSQESLPDTERAISSHRIAQAKSYDVDYEDNVPAEEEDV